MKRYSKDIEARPGPSKQRCVYHSTFKKWQNELDKEFQAMSWLDCEVSGAKITKLACKNLKVKLLAGETTAIIIVIKWVDHSK